MMRILAPVLMFQLYSPTLSAAREQAEGQPAPVDTVSVFYIALFGIIFVGMIVGFFIRLFLNERKAKAEQK